MRYDEPVLKIRPLLCGSWSCDLCGYLRYVWFRRNVESASRKASLAYFWTLTLSHQDFTPAQSWLAISEAWNRFRTRMVQLHGSFAYVWVVEPTQSGHAHLHVLVNQYWQHAEVRAQWKRATRGSYIVYVEKVEPDNVSRYLAKYMVKVSDWRAARLKMPGGFNKRRFGKGGGVRFEPFRVSDDEWVTFFRAYRPFVESAKAVGEVVKERKLGVPSCDLRVPYELVRQLGLASMAELQALERAYGVRE